MEKTRYVRTIFGCLVEESVNGDLSKNPEEYLAIPKKLRRLASELEKNRFKI